MRKNWNLKSVRLQVFAIVCFAMSFLLMAPGEWTPTPTVTPTVTPTNTVETTPTNTQIPTFTPTSTATSTPISTATFTPTPTSVATDVPTATPTYTPPPTGTPYLLTPPPPPSRTPMVTATSTPTGPWCDRLDADKVQAGLDYGIWGSRGNWELFVNGERVAFGYTTGRTTGAWVNADGVEIEEVTAKIDGIMGTCRVTFQPESPELPVTGGEPMNISGTVVAALFVFGVWLYGLMREYRWLRERNEE